MRSEDWPAVRDLFESLVELSEAARRAQLEEVAVGDPALAQEVASLLAAEGRANAFLSDPLVPDGVIFGVACSAADREREGLAVGRRLGAYVLQQRLGSGGMGTVYLGVRVDDAFEHRVAIKVIRQDMENAEALRRFRTERQILASLDHPAIARLFDGGTTDDGLPYLVMEHVEGMPIDAFCDAQQLGVGARLALMRQVCAAVHYAHQNLVVHRDLKPSNILVTATGAPKLLDFGIAKLLAPSAIAVDDKVTASGLRPMTPSYASPEQVRGEAITTATDVYALGVLLYSLLVGRLPFDVRGLSPAQLDACYERRPLPPSIALVQRAGPPPEAVARARGMRPERLRRVLVGDLDTIVLAALHSAPARRYGSAAALAEDLERHTVGLPVLARPDTLAYRCGKAIRRNPLAATLATLALVAILTFAFTAAWQAHRIARERDRSAQVLDYVEDIFKLADPREAPGDSVRSALARSSTRIAHELAGEPLLQAALMSLHGEIFLNLGQLEEAQALLEPALARWRAAPNTEAAGLIDTLVRLGAVYREQADYDAALALTEEAVALAGKRPGQDDRNRVEPLNALVTLHCYRGAYEDAAAPSAEVLALAEAHLPEVDPRRVTAVTNEAVLQVKRGDYAAGEATYREALRLLRSAVGDSHPAVADLLNNLGSVLYRQEKMTEAEVVHRQALAMRRTLLGNEHLDVATSLANLGNAHGKRGDLAAAREALAEALRIRRQQWRRETHPGITYTVGRLATFQLAAGEPQAAVVLLAPHLAAWHGKPRPDHHWYVTAEGLLGEAFVALGRYGEAEPLLQASYEARRAARGETHASTAGAQKRLDALYAAWGRPSPFSSSP